MKLQMVSKRRCRKQIRIKEIHNYTKFFSQQNREGVIQQNSFWNSLWKLSYFMDQCISSIFFNVTFQIVYPFEVNIISLYQGPTLHFFKKKRLTIFLNEFVVWKIKNRLPFLVLKEKYVFDDLFYTYFCGCSLLNIWFGFYFTLLFFEEICPFKFAIIFKCLNFVELWSYSFCKKFLLF